MNADSACERLMTVPGIGPIVSSPTVAAIGTGDVFSKGRDFGAWLGLVPKQMSTGGRPLLGRISKRGNRYLRVLFVQAARVVLLRPASWERYGLKRWIEAAAKRLHPNKLTCFPPRSARDDGRDGGTVFPAHPNPVGTFGPSRHSHL
jgi:transposase